MIRKLRHILPRHSLINIYKSFVRLHLDYCDIIYDQHSNKSFCNKIERAQDNAALAVTGAIRRTSQTKQYKKFASNHLNSGDGWGFVCSIK